jgi:hypothetical protein
LAEGALWGHLILVVIDDTTVAAQLAAALADADVVVTDQARGAIMAERPFLSAAVLGSSSTSRESRAIVRRLRERNVPFVTFGTQPPDATIFDGAPFISSAAPADDVVTALAFLISVQRPRL